MENSDSSLELSQSQSEDWKELIQVSKTFSSVNKVKLKYEKVLKELTLFQNLIDLGKGVKEQGDVNSKILEAVFKITVQSTAVDLGDGTSGENIIVSVKNISDIFIFSREFWSLCLDVNQGAVASVWKFEREVFRPGDIEKFLLSNKFVPNFNSSLATPTTLEIKVSLVLNLGFDGKEFQRIFDGTTRFVDVLFLLTPARRLPYRGGGSGVDSLSYFCSAPAPPRPIEAEDETEVKYPPITKFKIKLDAASLPKFPALFLRDSLHRGFKNLEDEFETLKEFSVYFEGDLIQVSLSPQNSSWTVQCQSNPKLLFAIKISVFKRLLGEGLKIKTPSDPYCETLCKLNFKLEAAAELDGQLEGGDYHEIYLMLREVSEQFRFSL